MTKRHIAIFCWLVLSTMIFTWTVTDYSAVSDVQLQREILIRHGVLMMLLTLPSGWLLSTLLGAVMSLVGLELNETNDATLMSISCFIAGYVQWFVVMPRLWRKWHGT